MDGYVVEIVNNCSDDNDMKSVVEDEERQIKSLGSLTKKLIDLLNNSPDGVIYLGKVPATNVLIDGQFYDNC